MEFRILGPLEVWQEGQPLHIRGAKERALLVSLLLSANEPVSVDRLVDELWGESPPATARKSLQVRVAGLRRTLGDSVLLTRPDAYLIAVAPDELDLHRFERLAAAGERALADGDADAASAQLLEALELWRGPALADVAYESFAQPALARLEELRLAALALRIDADLARGLHSRVIAELQELTAAHPLHERLRAQLMLALYRDGRQAEALEVYGEAREQLVAELGLEPGPALQRLQQAMLRQEQSLEAPERRRSILVASRDVERLDALLALAGPMAKRPPRELIAAHVLPDGADVTAAARALERHRETARTVAFTSRDAAVDVARIAREQDVDLLLVDELFEAAPCDVGALVARHDVPREGPVLILFAGTDHDWAAVELGAWIAGAHDRTLRLAGPAEGPTGDASRILASASLAVQRAFGIAAEPMLLAPAESDVVGAADDAALVVAGVPERRSDGLGRVRSSLVERARPPVLLVRRGLRPGGLAPPESLTRFTWTLRPSYP